MRSLFSAAFTCLVLSGPAWAGLEICNDTSEQQAVAIGYKSDDQWVSEGWWNIPAQECRSPIQSDLKNRYYYMMARSDGWEFADENILFCVQSEVFTIVGDENCEARGYETGRFIKIDTGTTAKQHTHFLSGYAFAAQEPGGGQTSYGEPYADNVTFQSCPAIFGEGDPYCTFHGGGTKFFVNDDMRTPPHVFGLLRALLPGTPLYVEGELTGIFDTTAEVVLTKAEPRPWREADRLLDHLQGHWYSVSDPNEQFTVLGGERENSYDGQVTGVEYLSIQERCGEFEGAGPYLYARGEETGEGYCYGIEYVGDWDLTLMYLPRGLFQDFRKLD
ncbi:DUF1036 domain-containing protein [Aliisedimentitalea scapharcae]|uniref:DUF1036 domain-containing protein n=1 Tax=Aliisedimentitalea scapharcae TaxID=1524259 RepID=A0ABZ2XTG5_9RHOB